MPDKQLQQAIEEIRPILRKYDCCAMLILQSQTHCEFAIHLEPKWSCVCEEEVAGGGKGIRIRAYRKDYPTKEAHNKALALGVGILMGFIDVMEHMTQQLKGLVGHISEKSEILHWYNDETDPANRRKIL